MKETKEDRSSSIVPYVPVDKAREEALIKEREAAWFETFVPLTNEKSLTISLMQWFIKTIADKIKVKGGVGGADPVSRYTIVDVGCGEGTLTEGIAAKIKEASSDVGVYGIDKDRKFVEETWAKLSYIGIKSEAGKEEIIVGDCFSSDLDKLPYNPSLIIVSHIAYYAPDIEKFVHAILSKAGPNTTIIFAHQSPFSGINKLRSDFDSPVNTDVVLKIDAAISSYAKKEGDVEQASVKLYKVFDIFLGAFIELPKSLIAPETIARAPYDDLAGNQDDLAGRRLLEFLVQRPMEGFSDEKLTRYLSELRGIVIKELFAIFWDQIQIVAPRSSLYYRHIEQAVKDYMGFRDEHGLSPIHLAALEGNEAVITAITGRYKDAISLLALEYISPLYMAILGAIRTGRQSNFDSIPHLLDHKTRTVDIPATGLIRFHRNVRVNKTLEELGINLEQETEYQHPLLRTIDVSTAHADEIIKKVKWIFKEGHFLFEDIHFIRSMRKFIAENGSVGLEPDIKKQLMELTSQLGQEKYFGQGKYSSAVAFELEALQMRRELSAGDDPETIKLLTKIAWTYIRLGNSTKALEHGELAYKICIHKGEAHPDTVNIMLCLATAHSITDPNGAKKEFEKCRELYPDKNHKDFAIILYAQAYNLRRLNAHKDALICAEEALVIEEALSLGKPNPDLARTLNLVACEHENSADYYTTREPYIACLERALSFKSRSLKMREELHKDQDHPDTALTFFGMGDICRRLKMFGESMEYYQKSLEIHKKLFPSDSKVVLEIIKHIFRFKNFPFDQTLSTILKIANEDCGKDKYYSRNISKKETEEETICVEDKLIVTEPLPAMISGARIITFFEEQTDVLKKIPIDKFVKKFEKTLSATWAAKVGKEAAAMDCSIAR